MDPQAIPAEAQQIIDALPPLAAIALTALVVVGVVLWLLGRSLAKPACAVSGLVIGGLGGYVVGQALSGEGSFTLPLVLGAAIAGALLAVLLFRIWMGVTAAAILALTVPAAVIVWQGTPITLQVRAADDRQADASTERVERPDATDVESSDSAIPPVNIDIELPQWPIEAADPEASAEKPDPARRPRTRRGQAASSADEAAPGTSTAAGAIAQVARTLYERQAESIRAWWSQLGTSARWLLGVTALAGGAAGLVIGLALPQFAASLQTAVVGAVLIFFGIRGLAEGYMPSAAGYLPSTPRTTLVTLGLITLLGVLIQWALFYRRTDR